MKRFALAALLLAASTIVCADRAAAANEQIPYHCVESPIAVINPGTFTLTGQALHVRDQHVIKQATGDLYCAGMMDIQVESQFNLQLGSTVVQGTYQLTLAGFDGGFFVTFRGNGVALSPTSVAWTSTNVGHGFGELEGWQLRGTTTRTAAGAFFEDGFVFEPGG
jgi:hypothetical protein